MLFSISTRILHGISTIHRYKSSSNLSGEGILFLRVRQAILPILLLIVVSSTNAQDLTYARGIVKTLSAEKYHGRGYVKNGDFKTAKFLRSELKRFKINPLTKNYLQDYYFPVNTFPGITKLKIENKLLIPGTEFTIRPSTPTIHGKYELVPYDTTEYYTIKPGLRNKFALLDTAGWGKQWYKFAVNNKRQTPYRGIIQLTYKTPGTAVSVAQSNTVSLFISKNAMPQNAKNINIDIDSRVILHKAHNVLGILPGKTDTFIVFTAHYDHLGRMGRKTYFPGANDNASGTAMALDFAKTFANSTNKYSFAFMFFSGEEAGLLGSEYYASNPAFPLNKIKIVINLDMVATGVDGISIFNGSSHPREFAALDSLNKNMNLGLTLKQRGPSQGSDHFPFHKRGVKALFFLTDDKNAPYHTTTDTYDKLSFDAYERLFKLIQEYIKSL